MISLIRFEEFGPGLGFPSMKSSFCDLPYKGQTIIASYLKMGKKTYSSPGYAVDVFTGETIPGEKCGMTDGEYTWNSALPYYVEKYNLRLPSVFEEKVLGKKNIGRPSITALA